MVMVTEPSSLAADAGAVSQGWKRSGSSSSGWEVQSQQMNRARLSSSQGVGGWSGGSLARLSAARVARDGGWSPSNWVRDPVPGASDEAAVMLQRASDHSGRPDLMNRRPLDPSHLPAVTGRGWGGLTEDLTRICR